MDNKTLDGNNNNWNANIDKLFENIKIPEFTYPKWWWSIKWIDEKFQVNSQNWTSSLNIALPITNSRDNFNPMLSLSYNSWLWNGIFWLWWDLGISSISIKTDKWLPKYDNTDIYQFTWYEDLIQKVNIESNWEYSFDVKTEWNYTIATYIPRIESWFSRIEKISSKIDWVYWKITSKDNIQTFYWYTEQSRIFNPENKSQIYKWLIDFSFDNKWNWIKYNYKDEDFENFENSIYNKNILDWIAKITNKYIKRIKYWNYLPYYSLHADKYSFLDPTLNLWTDEEKHAFDLVFDYWEHDIDNPKIDEELKWFYRNDSFSSFRSWFEIRTSRLCNRVLMYHNFSELWEDAILVKSTNLIYEKSDINNQWINEFTYLKNITNYWYTKNTNNNYNKKSFPPITFEYQSLEWNTQIYTADTNNIINLTNKNFKWIDLYWNALPWILTEQNWAWYYSENLWNIEDWNLKFSNSKLLMQNPSIFTNTSFQSLESNNVKQLVINDQNIKWYYDIKTTNWETYEIDNFVAFNNILNLDWNDTNTRFIDLNWDWKPDLVVSENDAFIWYENDWKKWYKNWLKSLKQFDENLWPNIVFSDSTQSIFLADMNWDWLTDIVRIKNGEISYWANKGYWRFSSKITMSNSPIFDNHENFNPKYIYLSDISGSGLTDIIYLWKNSFWVYVNCSWNTLSDCLEIPKYFDINNLWSLQFLDILWTWVWTISWLDSVNNNNLKYIDLNWAKKAHIMKSYNNNLWKETIFNYQSSTYYYLKDKIEWNNWITSLAFPVNLIDNVKIIDYISSSELNNKYIYHHWYYDVEDREFRWFWMVEKYDEEIFDTFDSDNLLDTPPILTKIWYHTWSYTKKSSFTKQYQNEYFTSEDINYNLADSEIILLWENNYDNYYEANRSLKWKVLREEVYSIDWSEKQYIPYTIIDYNYKITQIQQKFDNTYSVFMSTSNEKLTHSCERKISDPRISHQIVLDDDEYGFPTSIVNINYPRKSIISDVYEEQLKLIAILETYQYEHEIEDYYRLGLPIANKKYEINWLEIETDWYFSVDNLKSQITWEIISDEKVLKHNQQFSSWVQARLISHEINNYFNKSLWLIENKEKLVFSDEYLNDIFDSRLSEENIIDMWYINKDDSWWISSKKLIYNDSSWYYLVYKSEDYLWNSNEVIYDNYFININKYIDAIWNELDIELDYRVLNAVKITDINKNTTENKYDELWMLKLTSTYWTEYWIEKWDKSLSLYESVDALDFDDIVVNPSKYLQSASVFIYYSIDSYTDTWNSPRFIQLSREKYTSESSDSNIIINIWYSDWFGRLVQSKINYDDTKWLVSWKTVYNNKQKPIKQYEPFFSNTYILETEKDAWEKWVTSITYYDPIWRTYKVESADWFHSKVIYDTWYIKTYDYNDTLVDSKYYSDNFSSTDDSISLIIEKSTKHYDTPIVQHLDTLGRQFIIEEIFDKNEEKLINYREYDIFWNLIAMIDPRQYNYNKSRDLNNVLKNFQTYYDLLWNDLKTISIDAWTNYKIANILWKIKYIWNAKNYVTEIYYDELSRPTYSYVKWNDLSILYSKIEYWSDTYNNSNWQIIKITDSSWTQEFVWYDISWNAISTIKKIFTEYKEVINLENDLILDEAEYLTESKYDRLWKLIYYRNVDGSITYPSYNNMWLLIWLDVKLRSSDFWIQSTESTTNFIKSIDYNEKWQRINIIYSNWVETKYVYDDINYKLKNIYTSRNDWAILQDISYIYDPIWNILQSNDKTIDNIFVSWQEVNPSLEYDYDSLYQLIEASGREHKALTKTDYLNNSDEIKNIQFANINDMKQLRNYTRNFQYDEAWNLIQISHLWASSYTTDIKVSEKNNRAITDQMDLWLDVDSYFDEAWNMIKLDHLAKIEWNFNNTLKYANIIERETWNDSEYYVYDYKGNRTRKVKETYNSSWDILWIEEKIYLWWVEIKRKYQGNDKNLRESRSSLHIFDNSKHISIAYYWDETNDSSIIIWENKIHFQLDNHLWSASLELSDAWELISYEEHYPFGWTSFLAWTKLTEVNLKEYSYTWKEKDDTTWLYYYWARYYAQWMWRWLNPDPSWTVDGTNLYRYVKNNPINFVDPNGRESYNSWIFLWEEEIDWVTFARYEAIDNTWISASTLEQWWWYMWKKSWYWAYTGIVLDGNWNKYENTDLVEIWQQYLIPLPFQQSLNDDSSIIETEYGTSDNSWVGINDSINYKMMLYSFIDPIIPDKISYTRHTEIWWLGVYWAWIQWTAWGWYSVNLILEPLSPDFWKVSINPVWVANWTLMAWAKWSGWAVALTWGTFTVWEYQWNQNNATINSLWWIWFSWWVWIDWDFWVWASWTLVWWFSYPSNWEFWTEAWLDVSVAMAPSVWVSWGISIWGSYTGDIDFEIDLVPDFLRVYQKDFIDYMNKK